ncbi:MAG: lysophospholipid acyltransferase family protein, partial [Planctomycetota bacterium]
RCPCVQPSGSCACCPTPLALGIFDRLGRLAWYSARRRRIGRANVAQALPGLTAAQRDRLVRVSSGQMARSLAEPLMLAPRYTLKTAVARFDFEPGVREYLEGLAGKGAVFVHGHFGGMETMDGILGMLGLQIATPMRPVNNYYLEKDILATRKGWNVDLIPRQGGLRKMISNLRQGRSVVLAADVNAHHAPIFVPWFGKPAASDRAAAYLALRMGKPLVVCWCVRIQGRKFWRVGCKPILEPEKPAEITETKLFEVTRRIHAAMEEVILRAPEQYLWIHDRYRTRPPGEAADTE